MEPETLIGYLLALAVPLWLLVEGALVAEWPSKQSEKAPAKPPSAAAATRARRHAMRVADPRKTA